MARTYVVLLLSGEPPATAARAASEVTGRRWFARYRRIVAANHHLQRVPWALPVEGYRAHAQRVRAYEAKREARAKALAEYVQHRRAGCENR